MNTDIWDKIAKYIKGEASEIEKEALHQWIQEDPENQIILDEVEKMWKLTGDLEFRLNPDVDEEWVNFKTIRDKEDRSTKSFNQSELARWIYRAAAILVVGLGFIYLINSFNSNTGQTEIILANTSESLVKKKLPDGSEIWLNKNSQLTLSKSFNSDNRAVILLGEAFFEVKKDVSSPFTITSGNVITEVLGTSFNVRAISGENQIEVVVVTGQVSFGSVENASSKLLIDPGFKGVWKKETKQFEKSINEDTNFLSWREKELTYDQESFDKVVISMERYFQIEFQIENTALLDCHYTGKFKDATLEEVLEIIGAALNLEFKIDENIVTLSGEGCNK